MFETKTARLSNYRRRTDVIDIIRNSFSYIITKWQTDEKEAKTARTFRGDKMRSKGPTRDKIERYILMKQT